MTKESPNKSIKTLMESLIFLVNNNIELSKKEDYQQLGDTRVYELIRNTFQKLINVNTEVKHD